MPLKTVYLLITELTVIKKKYLKHIVLPSYLSFSIQ